MRARKEFPKDSTWQSLKGPFREALERRALPPRLRFVSEFPLGELTPSVERRSLSLAREPAATHAPTDLSEWCWHHYLADFHIPRPSSYSPLLAGSKELPPARTVKAPR